MPLTTDHTDAAFDSYLDISASVPLLDKWGRLRKLDAWILATTAQKEQYLRLAALWLRDFATYKGTVSTTVTGGVAVFPRDGLYYPNGVQVSAATVPAFVLDAQLHRALDYAEEMGLPETEELADSGEVLEQALPGGLRMKFAQPSARDSREKRNRRQERASYSAVIMRPHIARLTSSATVRRV